MTNHWDTGFQALFELQNLNRASILRITSVKPQLSTWPTDRLVTLVGDEVHVMSPTVAVGAAITW